MKKWGVKERFCMDEFLVKRIPGGRSPHKCSKLECLEMAEWTFLGSSILSPMMGNKNRPKLVLSFISSIPSTQSLPKQKTLRLNSAQWLSQNKSKCEGVGIQFQGLHCST